MSKLLLSILDSAQRVCGLEYQLNGAGLLYPAELPDVVRMGMRNRDIFYI